MILLLMSVLTFFASLVGVSIGFGLSTIMIPVLVIYYPFPQVLLLVGVIHWFSNIWKVTFFRKGLSWRLIFSFGIPGVIASVFGALLSIKEPQGFLSQTLGFFLIFYVIFLSLNPTYNIKQRIEYAIAGGAISGFLAGIFGFRGAIRSSFLAAFNLPKETFLATGGAIALVVDSARLITYWAGGSRLNIIPLWAIGMLIIISWLGSYTARYVVHIIPQAVFRPIVTIFLFLMGLRLVLLPF